MTMPVAVVTGGARGIGAAIANTLAATGFAVAVWDIDEAAAMTTAGRIGNDHGVLVLGLGVDVSSSEQVRAATERAERDFGPIAALVNNAGIDVIKPFVESTEDEW